MSAPRAPRRGLGRAPAVGAVVGLGVLALALTAAPWLVVPVSTAIGDSSLAVRGADAVPAAPAAALALLAAGFALALVGRLARVLAAVAVILLGLVLAGVSAAFLLDARAAALTAVADASGVRALAAESTPTAWPAAAAVVGVLAAGLGAVVAVASRRWSSPVVRRYERERPPEAAEGLPGGTAEGPERTADVRRGDAASAGDARSRAMDDWDALTRGVDPS